MTTAIEIPATAALNAAKWLAAPLVGSLCDSTDLLLDAFALAELCSALHPEATPLLEPLVQFRLLEEQLAAYTVMGDLIQALLDISD